MSAHEDDIATDHGEDAETHHYDYRKIYFMLVGLFFISYMGPWIGIKWITLIAAFGVAFVKAGLVIKYFMHFDHVPAFVKYFSVTALVFMVLFFAGVAPDVHNHHGSAYETHGVTEYRWENVGAKSFIEQDLAAQEAGTGRYGAHGDAGHEADGAHEAPPEGAHH